MAVKTKGAAVSFEELSSILDDLNKFLDAFRNGEFLSKNKSEKLLKEFRKKLSTLDKKIPGARLHSFILQEQLMPKVVAESMVDAHLPEETKVEVPE